MSVGPANLYALASALLDAVVAEFAADGVDLPQRRVITGYQPVPECEQVVVTWSRVWVGQAGSAETPQPVYRSISRVAGLTIFVHRCVWTPEGEALEALQGPSPEVLAAEAEQIMTDGYTLHRGISRAHFDGTFGGVCSALSIGPAEPLPPSGGISGTTMQLTAELS